MNIPFIHPGLALVLLGAVSAPSLFAGEKEPEGVGIDIVGQLRMEENELFDFRGTDISIRTKIDVEYPEELATEEQRSDWWQAWKKSPEGQKVFANVKSYTTSAEKDGTFKVENIVPGKYHLMVSGGGDGETAAQGGTVFIVPQDAESPLSLAQVKVGVLHQIKVGQEAAEFSFKTFDEKERKLSDFKGKWVIFDFWATWCGPCVAEMPEIKKAYESFRGNDQVTFVSLSLDAEIDTPRRFVQTHDMPWVQGFLGSRNTVGRRYGVRGIPAIFLISPDGKIAAKNLRGDTIRETIEEKLR